MDEQQKWKHVAAGVGAVALVAICCAIYGCSQDKKEQPKVMEYRQTTDPAAVKKKLGVSDQTAREITREIYHVQSSDTPPNVTYYVQAPDVQTGAEKVAQEIKNGSPALPEEATKKTDRTVVTANTDRQKVDVYKINLRKSHKIKAGVLTADGKTYGGVGFQAGRWEGMVYTRSGRKVEAASLTYTLAEW
ncbi:hypothetical protein [Acidaminococcus intestini]|jgi:hypothetical protein|uniref:hypothetical protein n=1 Tax=Acidaminococcus intestini TaxID=187327 RepID=UPI0020639F72|nr:hypothetical protein [Acidaminococcus intestini]DAP59559.1 MAG TPA: hypothetical protein [Caudoviricetes sp.]